MFKPEDIFCSEVTFNRRVTDGLSRAKNNGELTNYRSSFKIERNTDLLSWESGADAAKFLIAYAKHREFVKDNVRAWLASPLNETVHPDNTADYKWHAFYGGLKSSLSVRNLVDNEEVFVRLDQSTIDWINGNTTVGSIYDTYETYKVIERSEDSSLPFMLRIYEAARASAMSRKNMSVPSYGITLFHLDYVVRNCGSNAELVKMAADGIESPYFMEYHSLLILQRYIWSLANVKPSREELVESRNNLMYSERNAKNITEKERIAASKQNFVNYWKSLKAHSKSFVNESEVTDSFASIPLLPAGTASSRTWGIEIEVVQAHLTSRPRGWDKRGDGSLVGIPADDNPCECSCYYCEEEEDCGNCDNGDCDNGSTAEYVSPILNWFNSAGVQSLTRELEGSVVNDSAGIHIHVGARDLTVADVARLCVAYSAVSPFLWPLMKRNVTNYCRDISEENLVHWLHNSTKWLAKANELAINADVVYNQPDDRYRDLNLQSLRSHGTVEFRAMGPVYNYELLTRWAWMCRELINISRLNLPQSTWTSVRSMSDVVRILSTYGSEQVPPALMKFYEAGDSLALEERQELYA